MSQAKYGNLAAGMNHCSDSCLGSSLLWSSHNPLEEGALQRRLRQVFGAIASPKNAGPSPLKADCLQST